MHPVRKPLTNALPTGSKALFWTERNVAKGSQTVQLAVLSPGFYSNSEGKHWEWVYCTWSKTNVEHHLKVTAVSGNNIKTGKNISCNFSPLHVCRLKFVSYFITCITKFWKHNSVLLHQTKIWHLRKSTCLETINKLQIWCSHFEEEILN